jgi:D-alanine-D-alanine ligase
VTVRNGDRPDNPFGYPVFVKPARLGSSVGISKVGEEGELQEAVDLARRHDEKVLIEEFVPGVEVEVGVLGNKEPIASCRADCRPRILGSRLYDYRPSTTRAGWPVSPQFRGRPSAAQLAVEAFIATDCEDGARRLRREGRRRGAVSG